MGGFECSCDGNFEGDGLNCSLRCENGFQLPSHDATECGELVGEYAFFKTKFYCTLICS